MATAPPKVAVYEASGKRRLSVAAWKDMALELYATRELVWRLVHREFVSRYKQTYVGVVWAVLPPVATTIVFSFLSMSRVLNVGPTALPYPLFVLVGSTIWVLFSQGAVGVSGSIARGGSLVSKVYFPREALALSAMGSVLIAFLIQSLVVIVTFALYLQVPAWQAVLVPLALVPLVLLSLGLGLLLAPFNTMVRDVGKLAEFVLRFAMFLGPTVYPTPANPDTWTKQVLTVLHRVNPVSHFMTAARDLVTEGHLSEPGFYAAAAVCSVMVFLLGWRFFHICEPMLAERA